MLEPKNKGKNAQPPKAEDNYRLARKYMDAYVDSLVDEEKIRKENIVLIECVDKLIAEMRDIKGELTEIKHQNKAFVESIQYLDITRLTVGKGGMNASKNMINSNPSHATPTPINSKPIEDMFDMDFKYVPSAAPAPTTSELVSEWYSDPPAPASAPVPTAVPTPSPTPVAPAPPAVPTPPNVPAPPVAAPAPAVKKAKKEKKPKEDKPKNKVVTLISNLIFYLCMGLLLVGAISFAQSDDVNKSLFGFRYYYIKTASMEPVLPVGSIVLTKVTAPEDIKVGDDITVYVGDGKSDTYLTHRVVEITQDQSGDLAFRTKGVNAKSNDPSPYSAKLLAGKVVFCIPFLGRIMTFVQSQLIFVIAIFVLLLMLSFMLKLMFSKKDPETEPVVGAVGGPVSSPKVHEG